MNVIFKKQPVEWMYMELSEDEFPFAEVKILQEQLESKCCECCGSSLVVRKKVHINTRETQMVSYCPKCQREEKGTDIDVYFRQVFILTNKMI